MLRHACFTILCLMCVACLAVAGEKHVRGNAWTEPNPWMHMPEGASLQFTYRSDGEQDVIRYELVSRDEKKDTFTVRERIVGEGVEDGASEHTRPARLMVTKEEVLATETMKFDGRDLSVEKRRVEYRDALRVGDQLMAYEEWWHPDFAFPLRRVDPEHPADTWQAEGVETVKVDDRRLECLKVRSRRTRGDGAVDETTTWLHPEVPDWIVKEEWSSTKDKQTKTSSRTLLHWRNK